QVADTATYMVGLRSPAALTYRKPAAFGSPYVPEQLTFLARGLDGDPSPLRATAGHRRPPRRALSTARRTQESRPHHRVRTECTSGTRARDGPAGRAGRHRGVVAVGAGCGIDRGSVGPTFGAVGF